MFSANASWLLSGIGDGLKIVLAAGRAGFHKKMIGDVRLERCGMGARNLRFHAANVLAVDEIFDGSGTRIGNQVPDGKRIFIGLPCGERDDFDFGEFVTVVEAKNHGKSRGGVFFVEAKTSSDDAAGVGNLNDFGFEPVGEVKGVDTGECQQDDDENPIFSGHKLK